MISVRILTAETATPTFIDQLYACRNGFQNYLNLAYLILSDQSVSDIISILSTAVIKVEIIRISDLTFQTVSDPSLRMFAEFVSYVLDFQNTKNDFFVFVSDKKKSSWCIPVPKSLKAFVVKSQMQALCSALIVVVKSHI